MEATFERHWALPLRIILGVSFMIHGAPKLFDAQAHQGFQGMLGQLGVPGAPLMSWLLGLLEFGGGLALVLGLFTWVTAALLAIEMVFALLLVHLPQGFGAIHITGMTERGPIFGMPGYELNLLYIAGLLALFIGGPGPLSVDERAARGESALRAPWVRHRHAHA
ncbi:MAG TPA: DoxX family protein [Anaeromyxobacter sp.]